MAAKAKKWSGKVAAYTTLLDLIAIMRTSLQDANMTVDGKAVTLVGALAKGLRRSFMHTALNLAPVLTARNKGKKAAMLTAVDRALDDMVTMVAHCFNLGEALDMVNEPWSVEKG